MRARLVVRISPADVGERISVRLRRSGAPADEPGFTDVIGHLRDWTPEGRLTIERRDGTMTEVDAADLAAGRIVGPPPRRRR